MDSTRSENVVSLIRGGHILAMGGHAGDTPFDGDILIKDGEIVAIGPDITAPKGAEIIEAADRLVMPGLVNAHTHSSETFFRGRYEGLPLELWLLYAYPLLMGPLLSHRMLYLRSLLLAMESLKSGVTLICDDFFDPPQHDHDRLAMVFKAYSDVGIRANVASAVMNIHPLDAMPFARELVPKGLQDQLDFGPMISAGAYIDYCKGAFEKFHQPNGRLRFMIAPSAPQRCSPELLQACSELARERHVPLHSHVLETKTQAVTGNEFYGKSLVSYMNDLGILNADLTIAHSVWVSEADIDLMGEAGCAVAHNAISNLKLGAGIAPIRRLLKAGVPVALGTDGVCSNDTARIFDVMRVAALVQSGTGPHYQHWLTASETLRAATMHGARSAALGDVTGSLEVGKRADILILRMDTYAFTPLNDVRKHLVYAENGSSIERVIVDGVTVVRDNVFATINEAEILAEIREAMPKYLAEHSIIEVKNTVFHEYFDAIHQKATGQELGFNRYWASTSPSRENVKESKR
jgi:5-methylthioadenosine/S-adenosylhomocysteine deaminase